MASIRRVTRKPPTMLIDAIRIEIVARTITMVLDDPTWSMAPTTTIPEIAFVTAISGVCSEWLTFQITWKPTKQASTKTVKWPMKLAGATAPTAISRIAATINVVTCDRVCALKAATSFARFCSGVSSSAFGLGFCAAIALILGGGGGS